MRLILSQIGLNLQTTNWIMAFVSSVNFGVLLNGSPSKFFKPHRGVRQGCPLSPYLLLLVIEGLGRMLLRYKNLGLIQGIKISQKTKFTHLLFVDDVMMFGAALLNERHHSKEILQNFSKSLGMKISYKNLFC